MAGTVDLPAIGKVKSGYVWAGAAVVAVIVGYAYIRNKNSAAANSAGTGTAAAAATTDPATGYPSGSPEDLAALQAAGGGGYGAYGGVGGGYAGYGTGYGAQQYYYDPADGLYDLTAPYTGSTGTSNTGPGTFSDNAYWVQYAIQNVQGYPASDIQGALSAYLAGLGLTTTQMSIYQAALAVAGEPPHPPKTPAHLQNPGGGGGGGGGNATVPHVVGDTAGDAHNKIVAAGLVPTADPQQKPDWKVTSTSPAGGTSVAHGTRVLITGSAPGGNEVTVPNVVGMAAGSAHNRLVSAGLTPEDPHATARGEPQKKVRSTSPGAGARVAHGSHVTIST